MTIGEKIKQMRTESHMTQDALAQRLHISSQAISKWEQNLSAPDISLLPELAEVFRVTMSAAAGMRKWLCDIAKKRWRPCFRQTGQAEGLFCSQFCKIQH